MVVVNLLEFHTFKPFLGNPFVVQKQSAVWFDFYVNCAAGVPNLVTVESVDDEKVDTYSAIIVSVRCMQTYFSVSGDGSREIQWHFVLVRGFW